jgi:hypothetical protein
VYEFIVNCAVALAVPLLTPKSPIVHCAPSVTKSPTAAIAGDAIANAKTLVIIIFCFTIISPFVSCFLLFLSIPPPPCGSPAPVGRNLGLGCHTSLFSPTGGVAHRAVGVTQKSCSRLSNAKKPPEIFWWLEVRNNLRGNCVLYSLYSATLQPRGLVGECIICAKQKTQTPLKAGYDTPSEKIFPTKTFYHIFKI